MINLTYKDFLFTDIIKYIPNWTWQELKVALENKMISREDIIDYAKMILEEDIDNFDIILEIAIADVNDVLLPLMNKLITLENKQNEIEILNKWRFSILLYLYLNKDKYNNVYEIIAEISADFNHPEDMDGFIYYKPTDGIDMIVHWKNYLKDQCNRYNITYSLNDI